MQMWELEDHPVQFEGWFVRSTKESTSAGQFLALSSVLETLGIRHNRAPIWILNEVLLHGRCFAFDGVTLCCLDGGKWGRKFFFTYQVSTFPTVIYNQVPLYGNAIISLTEENSPLFIDKSSPFKQCFLYPCFCPYSPSVLDICSPEFLIVP